MTRLAHLKPYGRTRPARMTRADLTAWVLGIRDGWNQPHELSTSYNVEHLETPTSEVYESLDCGINLGQWLRSPLNHQRAGD